MPTSRVLNYWDALCELSTLNARGGFKGNDFLPRGIGTPIGAGRGLRTPMIIERGLEIDGMSSVPIGISIENPLQGGFWLSRLYGP